MEIDVTGKLRLNPKAREWCRLPYPDHPKGCPNYGMRLACPPYAPNVDEVFDLDRPLWMVVEAFNLAAHQARMLVLHPGWSNRQTRCVLYWQAGVAKRLSGATGLTTWARPGTISTLCPEAMGVNVIATLRRCGIDIRVHPTAWVYKAALVGYPV